jgi:hypothetical protein
LSLLHGLVEGDGQEREFREIREATYRIELLLTQATAATGATPGSGSQIH